MNDCILTDWTDWIREHRYGVEYRLHAISWKSRLTRGEKPDLMNQEETSWCGIFVLGMLEKSLEFGLCVLEMF